MYQPAVPVVQFSQVPTQPAPVIQIMQQPQIPSYPTPVLPPVVVQQVPETKSDDYCESYHRPTSCCSNRAVMIALVVGIVGAALVACVIVGVVVGLLITSTSSAEVQRTSCERTVNIFPYEFYVSETACVYGYFADSVCMYDSYFDAKNNTDKPCYGKTFGADHISARCYYSGDTTCHCSMAYREDENLCYNFAIDTSLVAEGSPSCTHGLSTGDYCLYEQRQKQNRNNCPTDWDKVNDDYCYKRKTKRCDKYPNNSISKEKCLKGIKIVVNAIN